MALSDGEIVRYRISIGSPTLREERSLCPSVSLWLFALHKPCGVFRALDGRDVIRL
jgi:hypothetical protein